MNLEPFPHVVIDGMWNARQLRKVVDEFPDESAPGWRKYGNSRELKREGPQAMWGPVTRSLFAAFAEHAEPIGRLFGFDDLTMEVVGGGYHFIPAGGFLDVHTDFNVSPDTGRFRVINMLVYLNADWTDPGGWLELWDDDGPVETVAPHFNRTVMFATSSRSWHGHPRPAQRDRRSLAAYFFSASPPDGFTGEQSTVFHPKGSDARELC